MKIKVLDIISNPYALLHDDGLVVFDIVKKQFNPRNPSDIEIDFSGIKRCSTLFLNASFGKLLAEFGEEIVRKFIKPSHYEETSNFMHKYNEVWDNFSNDDNYQAYRRLEFA